MKRLPDWDSRLADYLRESRDRTYHPVLFNCGIDVAGAIQAQTGVEITAKYDPAGGGYYDFCRRLAAELGMTEAAPLTAMRGDPVASDPMPRSEFDIALGICVGEQARFFHPDGDFRFKPVAGCRVAWRI